MGAAIREWSRDEIATRVLNGEYLFIYRNQVIRVPLSWLTIHPGGELAILHFVGRDATDEVEAYHYDETLKKINRFTVGYVKTDEAGWEPLLPPVASGWVRKHGSDGRIAWVREASAERSQIDNELSPSSQILLVKNATISEIDENGPTLETITPPPASISLKIQAQHSAAYKELHQRVKDAGLYKTRYLTGYGPDALRCFLIAAISALSYSKGWYFLSAALLGFLWQQLSFIVHDLGHTGVTHNWTTDRLIAISLADFIGGLSIGWWVDVRENFFRFLISATDIPSEP